LVLVVAPAVFFAWSNHLVNSEQAFDPTKARLASLGLKIEVYQQDTGELPKSLVDLVSNSSVPRWQGPYAREAEIHGLRDTQIEYQVLSKGSFKLSAIGRGGIRVERTCEP
jgi:hypothetical protein